MAKRGRPSLSRISSSSLEAELERRKHKHGKLYKQHAKLVKRLSALEAEIAMVGGSVASAIGSSAVTGGAVTSGDTRGGRGRRRRPKNATNLVEALVKVLKGRTMGVTEVSAAVQKAGYRTTSKTFRTIVNQALIKHSDRFKKIDRGQYTAA